MPRRTCFVIMPIGTQEVAGTTITASELRSRYDDLIKEALIKADSELEVVRADEIALPGTITTDILKRLMHSDLVVADVTFPNPNVFYELGIRHACRTGTVIIRDRNGPRIPFDIAHLRHFEYENTPTGLKELAEQFRMYFEFVDRNPTALDNQVQELASFTHYQFPNYQNDDEADLAKAEAVRSMMQSPQFSELLRRQAAGEPVDQSVFMSAMLENPALMDLMSKELVKSGQFPFGTSTPNPKLAVIPPNRETRRKRR